MGIHRVIVMADSEKLPDIFISIRLYRQKLMKTEWTKRQKKKLET